MSRTVPLIIDSFTGDFAFLDNCYPCEILFDGLKYPSAEHAYQASKTDDPNRRLIVANLLDGETARSYGKSNLRITSEFTSIRLSIMRRILEAKFFDNIHLAKMLIETMESTLLYPARGNDLFWGCRNLGRNGENQLGRLLMEIRAQMREAAQRAADTRLSRVKFSGGLGVESLRSRIADYVSALDELDDEQPPVTGSPQLPPDMIIDGDYGVAGVTVTKARVTSIEQTDNPNGLTGIGLSVPAEDLKDAVAITPVPPFIQTTTPDPSN